jgi:type II secretory pathway pseudopilin PulG
VGKLRRQPRRAERGFILLDVLAALAIAMIGISVFLGGLSGVMRIAGRQGERVHHAVEQRNADAEAQEITFPPA